MHNFGAVQRGWFAVMSGARRSWEWCRDNVPCWGCLCPGFGWDRGSFLPRSCFGFRMGAMLITADVLVVAAQCFPHSRTVWCLRLPVRRQARRWEGTGQDSWPELAKGISPTIGHLVQYQLGEQLAGRDWSLKGGRLDIGQQWGAAVLGITNFSGVSFFLFFFITIIITSSSSSSSIFYFVSVIKLFLTQTLRLFTFFPDSPPHPSRTGGVSGRVVLNCCLGLNGTLGSPHLLRRLCSFSLTGVGTSDEQEGWKCLLTVPVKQHNWVVMMSPAATVVPK